MGFEDYDESQGFEAEEIDLDGDEAVQMGTGRVKASRKRGIRSSEQSAQVQIARRDRMGRRGSNIDDFGSEADMLAPDKPTRIASGGTRRRQESVVPSKPMKKSNSEFSYLFGAEEEDTLDESMVSSKSSRLAALSMTGDEEGSDEMFAARSAISLTAEERAARPPRAKKASPAPEPEPQVQTELPREEPAEEKAQVATARRRFSRRNNQEEESESGTQSTASINMNLPPRRDSSRESASLPARRMDFSLSEGQSLEPTPDLRSPQYGMPPSDGYTVTNPDEAYMPQMPPQADPYAQVPGYGFQQLPPGQNPYAAYPYQQIPYGYMPVPTYPGQYPPAGYIPAGYVYQPGYVPAAVPVRRKRRASSARAQYRYDRNPMRDEVRNVPVRRRDEYVEESVYDLPPLGVRPGEPAPSQRQIDRMLEQIPPEHDTLMAQRYPEQAYYNTEEERPVAMPPEPVQQREELPTEYVTAPQFEPVTESYSDYVAEESEPAMPQRDYMRGGSQPQETPATTSRFNRRRASQAEAQPTVSSEVAQEAAFTRESPRSENGGATTSRFKRRGSNS